MSNNRSKRVTKDQWLTMALDTLEREGIDNVHVVKLARRLGVAKSGFYWHFRDRTDLLKQMLEYWAREYTDVVIKKTTLMGGSPAQHLEDIMRMIRDYELNRMEAVVFVWAQNDPVAKEIRDKVYKKRIDFIRGLFAELGFKGDDLEMRTQLYVGYMAWEFTTFAEQSKSKQNRLLKLRMRLLLQR